MAKAKGILAELAIKRIKECSQLDGRRSVQFDLPSLDVKAQAYYQATKPEGYLIISKDKVDKSISVNYNINDPELERIWRKKKSRQELKLKVYKDKIISSQYSQNLNKVQRKTLATLRDIINDAEKSKRDLYFLSEKKALAFKKQKKEEIRNSILAEIDEDENEISDWELNDMVESRLNREAWPNELLVKIRGV